MVCGLKEERPLKTTNGDIKVYILRSTLLPIIDMLSNHLQQDAIYADSPRGGSGMVLKDVRGINLETIC